MLTARLNKLKDRLFNVDFNQVKPWYFENETILTTEEIKKEPLVIRKALVYQYISANLPAYVRDDELIVGNPNYNCCAFGLIFPHYATKSELENAERYCLGEGSICGHHPPKWDKVLKQGVTGLSEDIRRQLGDELSKDAPDMEKVHEYQAMLISLESLVIFARRHADAAAEMAKDTKDEKRKKELLEIARVCAKVPLFPAGSFQEALQSYWFAYCIINSGGSYIPLARADQYLYPYYEQDIRTGRITEEEAIDLMGSFLVKCNERVTLDTTKIKSHATLGQFLQGVKPEKGRAYLNRIENKILNERASAWDPNAPLDSDANFGYGQAGNSWLLNVMLAGVKPDGSDATNALSYMIIKLVQQMHLLMPVLSARIHENTPKAFIDLLSEVLKYGQGEPAIYNDSAIIPGLTKVGISLEDARDYSNDGCWEVLIPGKSYFSYEHVETLLCLEWTLNDGVNFLSDYPRPYGLKTGPLSGFDTWEKFYDAFLRQVWAQIDLRIQYRKDNLGMTNIIAPDPLMSALMDDCIAKGVDMTLDGLRYYLYLIILTGLANTVDSLAVIRKLVYEEKRFTLEELVGAMKNNWEGAEPMRQLVMNAVPKFGNDDDYVDEIAVKFIRDFNTRVDYWREQEPGFLLSCGIGTFENYPFFGRNIGASADGRLAKDAIAPNYSPFFGRDIDGPTAILKSAVKADLIPYYGGCPVDISINSNEFIGETGTSRLSGIIHAFCELGGNIMTITGQNVDELRDAKVSPEKHKGLRVRMGGYSAYFVAMSSVQQDNIIRRFEKGR